MARIRSVHPGLFTDEHFVQLSPISQVFLIGIWTECDDHGIFEWKPITLKMKLMAAYSYDPLAHLEELVHHHMVRRIEVDGKAFGLVRNFCIWQRPKKPTTRYPLPDEWRTYVGLRADGTRMNPDSAHPAPPPVEDPTPIKGEAQTTTRYGKTFDEAGKRVLTPRVPKQSPTGGEIEPQRERREGGRSSRREEESNPIDKPVVVVLAARDESSAGQHERDWNRDEGKHDDNDEGDQSVLEGTQEPKRLADVPVPGMPIALPEDWTPNAHDEHVAKQAGMTPDIIEAQVLEFHAYNAHRGTLSPNWSATWFRFCSAWKAKQQPAERKVPPRVESSKPYQPTPDEWHKHIEAWKQDNSRWSRQLGAEPGMGGCRVPPVILQAHGIDPKTGMPLREPPKAVQS